MYYLADPSISKVKDIIDKYTATMNENLIDYIVELEARLLTAEKYVNEIAELNKLKVPTETEVVNELNTQRNASKKKYNKFKNYI